ncbi:MAG TPA: thiamine pyrophosphate-binding protein [Thermodesulfovibrionales bacterium]|nr:thiamine pyrophosphate-binding protein [Thermodesulfovibrionales bacterium]
MPGSSKADNELKDLRSRLRALTTEERADLSRCLSAAKTSGHSLVAEALQRCSVKHVLGITGTPVDAIFPECAARGIRPIGTRHQQAAVLMAAAGNYIAGRLESVVVVSAGPAVTNALTGLLVARDNGWPVIVMGGRRPLHREGIGYFQELDALPIFRSLTKRTVKVEGTSEIMSAVVQAYEIASSGRPGPVYLDLPEDVLFGTATVDHSLSPTILPWREEAGDAVVEATRLLTAAARPLLILGEGIRWSFSRSSLQCMVEQSGLPFITTPMARGFLPDDHPHCANEVRRWVQSQADVILMAGASFDWRFRFGGELAPGVRIIHVDTDPGMLGKNVKAVLTVSADSGRFLVQLQRALAHQDPTKATRLNPWHEMVNAMCNERRRARLAWLSEESEPMLPQQLFVAIRDFLPTDAVVVLDGSITLSTGQKVLSVKAPCSWLDPGWNGCMGSGIPFGMGAKLAAPERMVVVICGDYGFGLSAIDLETAVRHRIPVIVVIANNSGITGSLRQKGTFPPDYPELFSRFQPNLRYERIMEVFGGYGEFVAEAAEIRPALERAAASGQPSCINVSVDPDAPSPGVW